MFAFLCCGGIRGGSAPNNIAHRKYSRYPIQSWTESARKRIVHPVDDERIATISRAHFFNLKMEVMLSNVTLLDDNNSTGNISFVLNEDVGNPILALVLFSFCLATILGNALVIAAVARERYLHTVTNYFIMSLAVADCLVGSIVMPFSAAVEMQSDRQWLFGRDLLTFT